MDKSLHNEKNSDGNTYELKDFCSVQSYKDVSGTYETLDLFNLATANTGHSVAARCETVDDHDVRLLPTNKSNRKKLLFTIAKAVFVAMLLVALAAVVIYFLSSRKEGCVEYSLSNWKVVNATGYREGDTLQVECSSASKLVGSATVTCYSTGQWSDYPRCVLKECDGLVAPSNGKVILRNLSTDVGATVLVTCEEGFVRKGVETVVCQSNETWSDSPSCEPVDCGMPKNIENGEIRDMAGTTYNNTFLVVCSLGYQLTGVPTVVCKLSGLWGETPVCKSVVCGIPDIPRNGHIKHLDGTKFGSMATLQCDEGFFIMGNSTVSCAADGNWTALPICDRNHNVQDCDVPSNVANGVIKRLTGTKYNDSFSVECKENYILVGHGTVSCDTNGNWTNIPACIAQTNCGAPPSVENSKITEQSSTNHSNTFSVQCNDGYNIAGNKIIKCNVSGKWTALPSCTPVSCGIPETPHNGKILTITSTQFNAVATMKCDEGYSLVGSSVISCLSNGSWSLIPRCNQTDCGLPRNITNGGIKGLRSTKYNSTFSVECNEGYVLVGSTTVACKATGSWSEHPACIYKTASDCYEVYLNTKTSISGVYNITLWQSKEKIQVYCDMNTDGGGWTVFQYRYDGSVDFYNTLSQYVNGFGNLTGEFWLGLKYIQEIAKQDKTTLRIDLSAANGTTAYETFPNFHLSGPYYTLFLGQGTGTAGDGSYGLWDNRGRYFSTWDVDRDAIGHDHCAVTCHGAWWYAGCSYVNLNGKYLTPGTEVVKGSRTPNGMVYPEFISESLKSSKMMLRRR